MADRPRVLVIDDGELNRIRGALEGSGVVVQHLRGEVTPDDLEGPFELVIATVKRTLALEKKLEIAALPGKPVWIAVHAQDFLPLRVRLQQMGVHYLVQSSVGSEALRLLLIHSLYQGPERRDAFRLPVGLPVVVTVDPAEEMRAELLDLTQSGCRLFIDTAFELESRVVVDLPAKLAGGAKVALTGRLKRLEPHPGTPRTLATIAFEGLASESVALLDAILAGKIIGTVVTRLGESLASEGVPQTIPAALGPRPEAETPALAAPATNAEPSEPPRFPHKRSNRRAPYARKVTALLAGGTRVILGRDLSIAGMRSEHLPELAVGTELELAIYGASGAEPVLVKARVARDDGALGTVFHFTEMPDWERPRLETIISSIAEIQSLTGGESADSVVVAHAREHVTAAPRRRR